MALDVSRETWRQLTEFQQLVLKWNRRINLIGRQTTTQIAHRHVLDSAQLWSLQLNCNHWVDMGSGGGFPAIILALLAKSEQAIMEFTLIESDQRKAAFLRTAIREFNLQATVVPSRIELIEPMSADVISARALAPLDDLLNFTYRHIAQNGTAVFPKGKNWRKELEIARQNWDFNYEAIPSETDPSAAILKIEGLQRA